MLTQGFTVETGRPFIELRPAPELRDRCGETQGLHLERRWRHLEPDVGPASDDIAASRWTDMRSSSRWEEATSPADRYIVGITLKTTRLKLTRGRQVIFDGIMPAGTLHVTAPSKQLSAEFHAPCDFLHFHISADYLHMHRDAADTDSTETSLDDLILLRDSFAEQLGKALIEHGNGDRAFTKCIGQTLAMHIARLKLPRAKVNALPKWRLKRVEEYVNAHLHRRVNLPDLARAANLSRMHFAAQFRTATGYRPREYLLHRRIERAKTILSSTEMPLAEVALAVGFCTQAHFSTVFKRIAGETPARWRSTSSADSSGGANLAARSEFNATSPEPFRTARLD